MHQVFFSSEIGQPNRARMMFLFSNSSSFFVSLHESWISTRTKSVTHSSAHSVLIVFDALVMLLRCRNRSSSNRRFIFSNPFSIHVKFFVSFANDNTQSAISYAVKAKLINMQRQLLRKYIVQRSEYENGTKPYKSPMYGFFNVRCARTPIFDGR